MNNQPQPFLAGDTVLVVYPTDVRVGRRLTQDEAAGLNNSILPWKWAYDVNKPKGKIHYFPNCRGTEHKHLARTIRDTTCLHCLLERANQLQGWRWTHARNTEEVTYLTSILGNKVSNHGQTRTTS